MSELGGAMDAPTQGIQGFAGIIADFTDLLKPITDLLEPLNALLDIFSAKLQSAVLPAMVSLYDALLNEQVISAISTIAQGIGSLFIPAIEQFSTLINAFLASGALEALVDVFMLGIQGFNTILAAYGPAFDILLEIFNGFVSEWMVILDAFMPVITMIIGTFANFYAGIITNFWALLEPLIPNILHAFNVIATGFVGLFASLELVMPQLLEIFNKFVEIFFMLIPVLSPIIGILIDMFSERLLQAIMFVANAIEDAMPFIEMGLGVLVSLLNDLVAFLGPLVEEAMAFLNSVDPSAILATIDMIFGILVNTFLNGLQGFIGILRNVVNFFIGILNSFINGMNAIDVLNLLPDIPQIPMLQGGGLIAQSGIAVVHKGEGVLNREVMDAIMTIVDRSVTTNTSSTTYNNTVNAVVLTGENARMLAKEMSKQAFLVPPG